MLVEQADRHQLAQSGEYLESVVDVQDLGAVQVGVAGLLLLNFEIEHREGRLFPEQGTRNALAGREAVLGDFQILLSEFHGHVQRRQHIQHVQRAAEVAFQFRQQIVIEQLVAFQQHVGGFHADAAVQLDVFARVKVDHGVAAEHRLLGFVAVLDVGVVAQVQVVGGS